MNFSRKELKASAKKHFRAKYGWLLLVNLIYSALSAVFYGTSLLVLFLTGPVRVGLNKTLIKASKEKDVSVKDIFSGFKRYGPNMGAGALVTVFSALWGLLLIVPGIIKLLSYSLTYYILAVDDKIGPREAVKLSMKMMKGHKGQLFVLYLSFFGWILLNALTMNVLGILYVFPYMNQSIVEFHQMVYDSNKKPAKAQPQVEEAK